MIEREILMANHGGDIYSEAVAYDFSVNLSPLDCSGPHKDIIKAIEKKLANYPDVEQREFRKVVAEVENVKPKMIWGCNGASEALSAIVSMLKPKKSLLVDPCFGGYRHALSQVAGCNIESIRLNSANGFAVDAAIVDEIARAVTEVNNRIDLLIIANPNNPTGKVVPKECLEAIFKICVDNNIKMIVDECFIRMSDGAESMVEHIEEYDGLFVVNAFTKLFSIPGIRVGYVVSQEKNITELRLRLPEWNLSVAAQEAGRICRDYIKNCDWVHATREAIKREREYLNYELRKIGAEVFSSDSGFILFYLNRTDLRERLLINHILIRDCANYTGLGEGFYRIAVKDRVRNAELIREINKIMNEG